MNVLEDDDYSHTSLKYFSSAATVKLVLRSLPQSAKLVVEDPEEMKNVKALLISLKREADALKRHREIPPNDIRPKLQNS